MTFSSGTDMASLGLKTKSGRHFAKSAVVFTEFLLPTTMSMRIFNIRPPQPQPTCLKRFAFDQLNAKQRIAFLMARRALSPNAPPEQKRMLSRKLSGNGATGSKPSKDETDIESRQGRGDL
jgi:hypothetical protein